MGWIRTVRWAIRRPAEAWVRHPPLLSDGKTRSTVERADTPLLIFNHLRPSQNDPRRPLQGPVPPLSTFLPRSNPLLPPCPSDTWPATASPVSRRSTPASAATSQRASPPTAPRPSRSSSPTRSTRPSLSSPRSSRPPASTTLRSAVLVPFSPSTPPLQMPTGRRRGRRRPTDAQRWSVLTGSSA
jgi:hypothetical protein